MEYHEDFFGRIWVGPLKNVVTLLPENIVIPNIPVTIDTWGYNAGLEVGEPIPGGYVDINSGTDYYIHIANGWWTDGTRALNPAWVNHEATINVPAHGIHNWETTILANTQYFEGAQYDGRSDSVLAFINEYDIAQGRLALEKVVDEANNGKTWGINDEYEFIVEFERDDGVYSNITSTNSAFVPSGGGRVWTGKLTYESRTAIFGVMNEDTRYKITEVNSGNLSRIASSSDPYWDPPFTVNVPAGTITGTVPTNAFRSDIYQTSVVFYNWSEILSSTSIKA